MNCKPHSFKGTEGVVGLKRWFEKMEQVFEFCKCAEDDKVKFAIRRLKDRKAPHPVDTQKNKTYVWGNKQDEAFQILKEKLCNAPVLALPDGHADFVVYCVSRKERLNPRRVRVMRITIHSGLKTKILEAQSEASKDLKASTEWLRGLERHFEQRDNGEIYFFD
ncbi:putative reverse transcriptase domain-containing protein, partial [Tanacetum coccineum]